jgi:hypothetical protein
MSRHLGTFNRQHLHRHPEDHQIHTPDRRIAQPKARGSYMLGLYTDQHPIQQRATGGEKFFYGRKPRQRQRMAGDILNLDLTQSPGTPATLPLPKIGGAELRTPELTQ